MLRRCAAAALVVGATALAASPAAAAGTTGSVYGVTTDGRLVLFDRADPGAPFSKNTVITGIAGGDQLRGIDVRLADPARGRARDQLYAFTATSGGAGRVYLVDGDPASPTFAAATLVSTLPASVQVTDGQYDIDFDPVADALRIVGTDGQNLRLTDGPVATCAGTAGTSSIANTQAPGFGGDLAFTCVDGDLHYTTASVGSPTIAGAAYAPRGASSSTSLFDVDSERSSLTQQTNPDAGELGDPRSFQLAGGGQVLSILGFDISSDDASAAYVSSQIYTPKNTTRTHLLKVDLATGKATDVGEVGTEVLESIALAPAASDPAPVVPEAPGAVALPALGAATMGLGVFVLRKRKPV
jgi:hypothetical protein